MPSKRGRAWIPIPHEHETALRQQPECWAEFVDPAQKHGWNVALLDELHQEFRHGENARKRQDFSYDSWEALPEDGQAIHVSFVQQEESNERYEQMLSLISTEKTRQQLRLFVDGWLFVEIAQLENPSASQEQLETAANTIGTSVNRALKKLRKELSPRVSGLGAPQGRTSSRPDQAR